jgi:hypothetical protein
VGGEITDDQIRELKRFAEAIGRLSLAARCDDALDEDFLSRAAVRRARAECAEAYAEILAQ